MARRLPRFPGRTDAEVWQMVLQYLPLARGLARRHPRLGRISGTVDDLASEGIFGLYRAAELFDPGLGVKFSTYAIPWVNYHINRAVRAARYPVPVPHDAYRRAVAAGDAALRPPAPAEMTADLAAPADPIDPGLLDHIWRRVDRLGRDDWILISQRFRDGLGYRRMAEIHHTTITTVRMHTLAALARLRAEFAT